MEQLLKYWPVIVVITNILAMWVMWSMKKSFATHADVTKVGGELTLRIDNHNDRLIRIEEAQKRAPTHDDLGRMNERLSSINQSVQAVSGEVKGVSGELRAVRRSVEMINQYLIGGDK